MENAATRFGQRLAHTEKKYRDQALKKLTAYLTKKNEWTDLEWDKLWKALFYCMWMSDKRPVQEELSTNLSMLIHKIPSIDLALSFVHSFFRTMHREWHGIDGLRLDKFYSLIRKFVHQSFVSLQSAEWNREHVERFVSMVSSEIISQLPNGLRMHVSDLYLTELCQSSGQTVDTHTFLLLLEPFFTLLSSEYDKFVFKRVKEMVFLPMLKDYAFGPQPVKEATNEDNCETDEEAEEEEDPKVFEKVELARVQHRVFNIASADDTAERNRSALYDLYAQFFALTKVDSLKAMKEESEKQEVEEVKKNNKRKAEEKEEEAAPVAEEELKEAPEKKKRKKQKKQKQPVEEMKEELKEVNETTKPKEPVKKEEKTSTPVKETKTRVTKTTEAEPVEPKEPEMKAEEITADDQKKKKKKKQKKQQEDVEMKSEEAETPKTTEAKKPEEKKTKKPVKEEEKKTKEPKRSDKSDAKFPRCASCGGFGKNFLPKGKEICGHCERTQPKKSVKSVEKKTKETKKSDDKKPSVVVKSGVKFQRCGSCGGFGKNFLPKGKELCGHCERTNKTIKKTKSTTVSKKRKADDEPVEPSKKVTFGKNKALPYELSVKRLKASAKKEANGDKEIKGLLKKKSEAASRKRAADFF